MDKITEERTLSIELNRSFEKSAQYYFNMAKTELFEDSRKKYLATACIDAILIPDIPAR